jgi:glycosyltransferase involved in cell wall biosynthesis
LIELLTSPDLRTRMAHAAIARSQEMFSPEEHFRRWTALVREVATGNASVAAA